MFVNWKSTSARQRVAHTFSQLYVLRTDEHWRRAFAFLMPRARSIFRLARKPSLLRVFSVAAVWWLIFTAWAVSIALFVQLQRVCRDKGFFVSFLFLQWLMSNLWYIHGNVCRLRNLIRKRNSYNYCRSSWILIFSRENFMKIHDFFHSKLQFILWNTSIPTGK